MKKMLKTQWRWFAGLVAAALSLVFYLSACRTLAQRDGAFLAAHPREDEVLAAFGKPVEAVAAGDRFRDTGWRPLPDVVQGPRGYAFLRPLKRKIYVIIGDDGRVVSFTHSGS